MPFSSVTISEICLVKNRHLACSSCKDLDLDLVGPTHSGSKPIIYNLGNNFWNTDNINILNYFYSCETS